MHSWRAHIGLICPGSGPSIEQEFHRFLPAGVGLATTRLPFTIPTPEGLRSMVSHLEHACEVYKLYKHDVVVFGCTTGSLINGYDFDKQLARMIEDISGDPGLTTSTAILEAFTRLNVSRLAVLTPYPDETNAVEKKFLEDNGLHVTNIQGMGNDYLHDSIADIEPNFIYQKAKRLDKSGADCLFVSCCGLHAQDMIRYMEMDFGLPVVTSIQATLWAALRRSGVGESIPALGRLFC